MAVINWHLLFYTHRHDRKNVRKEKALFNSLLCPSRSYLCSDREDKHNMLKRRRESYKEEDQCWISLVVPTLVRILLVAKKSGNRERCRKLSLWNRFPVSLEDSLQRLEDALQHPDICVLFSSGCWASSRDASLSHSLSGLFFAWKGIVFAKKRDNEMMRERHNFLTHCWEPAVTRQEKENQQWERKLLPSWSDFCHLDVAFLHSHFSYATSS